MGGSKCGSALGPLRGELGETVFLGSDSLAMYIILSGTIVLIGGAALEVQYSTLTVVHGEMTTYTQDIDYWS